MKAQCNKCGFLTKVPYFKRHRFRRCFRCGGTLELKYTIQGEYWLQKKNKKSRRQN